MSEDKQKTGRYRLGSALIWAAAHGAIAWFGGRGLLATVAAACGGLIAGWCTAALLGRLARFGAGRKAMMLSGILLGVAVASGAVAGLSYALNWFRPDAVQFDWDSLGRFLLSGAVIPAAVLGLVTGIYVRNRIPASRE